MEKYPVRQASLYAHVPPGLHPPPFLREFYVWCAQQPWGTLGRFRLEGDRLDDFTIVDGSRCAAAFFSFLRCADGSRVGLWRPDEEPLDRAAVVCLGSGPVQVVAEDLTAFLRRLALGATGVDDLEHDRTDDARRVSAALLGWLDERGCDLSAALGSLDSTRISNWLVEWNEARMAAGAARPEQRRAAELLAAEIGLPDQAWGHTEATILCAGDELAFYWEGERFDPTAPLRDALFALREADRRELPEAGLWFEAVLRLRCDGTLLLLRPYLDRPRRAGVLDERSLRNDLLRATPSSYWLAPWMRALIA